MCVNTLSQKAFLVSALRRCLFERFCVAASVYCDENAGNGGGGGEREERWGEAWCVGCLWGSWKAHNDPLCLCMVRWWCHGWQDPKPTELVEAWHDRDKEECRWFCVAETGCDGAQLSILHPVPLRKQICQSFTPVKEIRLYRQLEISLLRGCLPILDILQCSWQETGPALKEANAASSWETSYNKILGCKCPLSKLS